MREISRIFEVKNGRKWEQTYKTVDEMEVYKNFSNELFMYKVAKSSYYTRLEQYNNYEGTRTIKIYSKIGENKVGRSVYTVRV